MRILTECELAARIVLPSVRAGIAIILLNRGFSLKSIGKILGVSAAAIHNYKTGKRCSWVVDRLLEDPEYRSRLERITDMLLENRGERALHGRLSHEICTLCKRFKEREGLREQSISYGIP